MREVIRVELDWTRLSISAVIPTLAEMYMAAGVRGRLQWSIGKRYTQSDKPVWMQASKTARDSNG